jgi:hypothetical protein
VISAPDSRFVCAAVFLDTKTEMGGKLLLCKCFFKKIDQCLFFNTQTMLIESILHDSLAMFSPKPLIFPDGIRTRAFYSWGGCDVHCATPPPGRVNNIIESLADDKNELKVSKIFDISKELKVSIIFDISKELKVLITFDISKQLKVSIIFDISKQLKVLKKFDISTVPHFKSKRRVRL